MPLRTFRKTLRQLRPAAPNSRQTARNALATAVVFANELTGRRLAAPSMVVQADGRRATVRVASGAHLDALKHIFVDKAYAAPPVRNPAVIVDLGGNIGLAAVYFALRYPAARIVCVEPARAPARLLATNIAPHPNVHHVAFAVTDTDGTVMFHEMPSDVGSSLTMRDGSVATYAVQARTLPSLLSALAIDRVDLLKVDVEGAELDVLRSVSSVDVVAIAAEIHLDLCDATLDDFREALSEFEMAVVTAPGEGRYDLVASKR
jgi:FkbM family methyltransferase